MSLVDVENEQYRRDILMCLFDDNDFTMNEIALTTALRLLGNPIGRDRLRSQFQWLKERGLIELSEIHNVNMNSAKLTRRGADIAEGIDVMAGIARMPL